MQVHKPVTVPTTATTTTTTTTTNAPTRQESLQLVQNLLRSSFAAISYLRGLFPEDTFDDVKLNGMNLKKLKRGVSETVDNLSDWLEKGCFDALEKQYLKAISFGVYVDSKDPSSLIETYEFSFTYAKNGRCDMVIDSTNTKFRKETIKMQSKKESVQAMTNMLKRILVMTQALQPISEPPQLTMKIFYYDNVTPHDYEPPNFRKGLPTDYDKEDLKTECFELGTVDSNHHK
ncbi:DNA-binding protein [Rhizoclosmatium globosum]|uniref:DNA-binding protein n=1 Tax=Rhizoclosmatium globosum TaxID=329046 RepID=A0A1Y2CN85_9FUNG|nr:DNA-binding protein [Rhizoclosmatium globosum]|eukprot:ORY47805.1 DNA-binding protein [Rhizoclosmatium globosum]